MELLSVPQKLRRGALRRDEEKSVASAVSLLQLMLRRVGLPDYANTSILDFGCGVKFTQALLAQQIPVRRYVGIDVYREMVQYLQENVTEPEFEYHWMNTHNEMYNKAGTRLSRETRLPVGDARFDLACLFSVFTHVVPDDFVNILRTLRRHIEDDGKLFFTCFLDDEIDEDFEDRVPDRPLLHAYYRESAVRSYLAESGWEPQSVHPPEEHIQHHFTCFPC